MTPQFELVAFGGLDSSMNPLPKQQNLPQRPTSLHLHSKSKEPSGISQKRLGKLKSNHLQVQSTSPKTLSVSFIKYQQHWCHNPVYVLELMSEVLWFPFWNHNRQQAPWDPLASYSVGLYLEEWGPS